MDIPKYVERIKTYQKDILDFFDKEENSVLDPTELIKILDDLQIRKDKHELRLFLKFILNIHNNHKHYPNFSNQIEQILAKFKIEILQFYSNSEIFDIFKNNKRLLLFVIREKMLTIDEYIFKIITTREKLLKAQYPLYFEPEIKPFMTDAWISSQSNEEAGAWIKEAQNDLPDKFEEKRSRGKNVDYICELIQNDLLQEFVNYVTKSNYSLDSQINASVYETNPFLINHQSSLIEYAAFYGSTKIFNYLRMNGVQLNPSLLLYSIHSNKAEMVNLIEENKFDFEPKMIQKCLKHSIKCHHNDIAKYIMDNYLQDQDLNSNDVFEQALKYYNFEFIEDKLITKECFYSLCKNDYYSLVDFFLKDSDLDVVKKNKISKSKISIIF